MNLSDYSDFESVLNKAKYYYGIFSCYNIIDIFFYILILII